jgi:hypothetical protein
MSRYGSIAGDIDKVPNRLSLRVDLHDAAFSPGFPANFG